MEVKEQNDLSPKLKRVWRWIQFLEMKIGAIGYSYKTYFNEKVTFWRLNCDFTGPYYSPEKLKDITFPRYTSFEENSNSTIK